MFEFGGVFASSTAMSAYFIGSAICVALNVLFAGWLCLRSEHGETQEAPRTSRLKVIAATAGATLFLLTGVGAAISLIASHRQAAAVDAPATTISVDDIQRHIDIKKLPVQEVADYM